MYYDLKLRNLDFKRDFVFIRIKWITVYLLMYKTLGMSEISKASSYGAADSKKDK